MYEGRYLSLIHRLLAERSDTTVRVNTFQFIPQNEVAVALSALLASSTSPIFVYVIARRSVLRNFSVRSKADRW